MDRSEVAELLGLTVARVSQMVREGKIPQSTDESHPRVATTRAIIEHFRSRTDLASLKREKLAKENELLDISLSRSRGEVMRVADVQRAWADLVLKTRDRILRIPSKLAPRLPFCKSETDMEKELRSECEDALNELSRPVDYQVETANDK